MKNLIAYVVCLLSLCGCVSYKSIQREADKQFGLFEYDPAIENYKKVFEKRPSHYLALRLATSHLKKREFKEAEFWYIWYREGGDMGVENYYDLTEIFIGNSKFEEAKQALSSLASLEQDQTSSPRWQMLYKSAWEAKSILNSPSTSEIIPFKEVNTTYTEFAYSAFGTQKYFVTDRFSEPKDGAKSKDYKSGRYDWTGNGFLQIYVGRYDSMKRDLQEIHPSSDFNFPLHAGPLSRDSIYLFITSTPKKGPAKHRKLEEIIPQITWETQGTEKARLITDTPTNFLTDPFWDADNQKLYFAADYTGGSGQLDLYQMVLDKDGTWTEPLSLGDAINTFGTERSPFVHKDTLYFASDGLGGLGGLDIYYVPLLSSSIDSIPHNMGVPYNSNKDDFFFFIDKDLKGLQVISSDRDGGMGMDDIYYINKIPEEQVRRIIIQVEDAETHIPLPNIGVELQKQSLNTYQNFLTEENGTTGFFVTRADTLINLNVFGQDYLNYEVKELNISNVDTIFIELQRLRLNTPMVLRDIYYDFDKYTIRPQESESVIKLSGILNDNQSLNVLLRSHADSRGTHSYNQKLSERRSKSVVDYLISVGINRDRIFTESYGEIYPVNNCGDKCSEYDHQLNRRTEILFFQGGFQAKPYEYPLLDMKNGNRMEVNTTVPEVISTLIHSQTHEESDSRMSHKFEDKSMEDSIQSSPHKNKYYLIAGSFATLQAAEKHTSNLKTKLLEKVIILPLDSKSMRYRVSLGEFEDYEKADLKLEYFQQKLNQIDLWIMVSNSLP